jgi:benzodiazapine receptor
MSDAFPFWILAHKIMRKNKIIKIAAISFLITLTIAIAGVLLAGNGMESWYSTLKMPWLNIPIWIFIPVQILYYLICGIIIYRILIYVAPGKQRNTSLAIFLTMMIYAEIWNFLFLGLESTLAGFVGIVIFSMVAIIVYLHLRRNERFSSKIFTPYLVWLLVDNIWIFELWRINR